MDTPIFVNEDVVWQSNKDALRLFFGRQQIAGGGQPFSLLKNSPPLYSLFQDTFVSVYSVAEVYGPNPTVQPGSTSRPFSAYVQGVRQWIEPEEPFQRFNHQQLFRYRGPYVAQMVGYTFEVPDLTDNPWLEWVPQPKSPESAIYPFRQIPQTVRGQPFNFLFYRSPNWIIESEADSVFRKPDIGNLLAYGRPQVAAPTFAMPNVLGFALADANAILQALGGIILLIAFEDTVYPIQPVPRGTVLLQYPLPNAPLISGFTFQYTLICSSGLMKIPDAIFDSVNNQPVTVIGSTQFP